MQHRNMMAKEKKKVVLTLCRLFPSNHPRSKQPTDFENKIKGGSKIHTIRYDGKDAWNKRYSDIMSGRKYLSVREWTGRPYNSDQRELVRYDKIGMQRITMTYDSSDSEPEVWVDGKKVPVEEVAKNDGLSVEDFVSWFFDKDNVFEGVIVHFTDFRY